MKKQILPALALLTTVAAFSLPSHAAGFNYTYAQATYDDFSIDFGSPVPGFDGDGFTGAGSFALGKGFFINGSFSFWDLDKTSADIDNWQVGGGWHMSLKPNLDLVFSGAFGNVDQSGGAGTSVDTDFLAARAAVRYRINKKFEIGGGIGFVDFDEGDNETEFHFNGLWNFTDRISGFAEYRDNDVVESISIGARFYFKTKRR